MAEESERRQDQPRNRHQQEAVAEHGFGIREDREHQLGEEAADDQHDQGLEDAAGQEPVETLRVGELPFIDRQDLRDQEQHRADPQLPAVADEGDRQEDEQDRAQPGREDSLTASRKRHLAFFDRREPERITPRRELFDEYARHDSSHGDQREAVGVAGDRQVKPRQPWHAADGLLDRPAGSQRADDAVGEPVPRILRSHHRCAAERPGRSGNEGYGEPERSQTEEGTDRRDGTELIRAPDEHAGEEAKHPGRPGSGIEDGDDQQCRGQGQRRGDRYAVGLMSRDQTEVSAGDDEKAPRAAENGPQIGAVGEYARSERRPGCQPDR